MPTQQQTAAPRPMSGAQLAALSPADRQAYFSKLASTDPDAYQAIIQGINRDYMKRTVRQKAICPPASGSGQNQTYATGTTLYYNAPSANNAFLEGFYIRINLKVDFATGASAVYAATAARELALVQNLQVLYNGSQNNFGLYILKHLRQVMGYQQPGWPDSVLAGNANSVTSTYMTQGALPVTGTSQTITLECYVPLNLLHPCDVRGLLPIDGNSTTVQINLQLATALLGNDPILNTWYAVSGTGHAVTLTAGQAQTVQVIACYRNGVTYNGPQSLPMNLAGLGTVQLQRDVNLTGLTAGTTYRQKIVLLEQHYYVLHVVVDGQQATKYSTDANINYIDFSTDSTGSNTFWKFGTGTNMSIQEFYNDIRNQLGQDLDEGVIPSVYGPVYNEVDASNLNGAAILNLDPSRGGWSDVHYGVQINSLASTLSGVTPRVETHCLFVNPVGLVAAA
jgi:hypothetical protein